MAKYTIKHQCGHVSEIQLFGKLEERDKKIKWLESQECFECKKINELKEAVLKSDGLPTLSGSEKQVAWALVIRQKWIDEGKKFFADKGFDYDESIDKMLSDYKNRKDIYDSNEERKRPISTLWRTLSAHIETNATFFIENR